VAGVLRNTLSGIQEKVGVTAQEEKQQRVVLRTTTRQYTQESEHTAHPTHHKWCCRRQESPWLARTGCSSPLPRQAWPSAGRTVYKPPHLCHRHLQGTSIRWARWWQRTLWLSPRGRACTACRPSHPNARTRKNHEIAGRKKTNAGKAAQQESGTQGTGEAKEGYHTLYVPGGQGMYGPKSVPLNPFGAVGIPLMLPS
jgi:hypothetical protein